MGEVASRQPADLFDLSSGDAPARGGVQLSVIPLDEGSSVRTERFVRRGGVTTSGGADPDPETYEKLDVEEVALAAGATILRLPMVYGARDHRRREEFVLRRVRAKRRRIPFGAGNLLWSKVWVRDLAAVVRLAAETRNIEGTVLNVAERRTFTMEQWARRILVAAEASAELVGVPDALLPADLELTGTHKQHQLLDGSRAREALKWRETDPEIAIRESVRWHLAHPPLDASHDFGEDDKALEAAAS